MSTKSPHQQAGAKKVRRFRLDYSLWKDGLISRRDDGIDEIDGIKESVIGPLVLFEEHKAALESYASEQVRVAVAMQNGSPCSKHMTAKDPDCDTCKIELTVIRVDELASLKAAVGPLVIALEKIEKRVNDDLSAMVDGLNDRTYLNNCVRGCRHYAQEALKDFKAKHGEVK